MTVVEVGGGATDSSGTMVASPRLRDLSKTWEWEEHTRRGTQPEQEQRGEQEMFGERQKQNQAGVSCVQEAWRK